MRIHHVVTCKDENSIPLLRPLKCKWSVKWLTKCRNPNKEKNRRRKKKLMRKNSKKKRIQTIDLINLRNNSITTTLFTFILASYYFYFFESQALPRVGRAPGDKVCQTVRLLLTKLGSFWQRLSDSGAAYDRVELLMVEVVKESGSLWQTLPTFYPVRTTEITRAISWATCTVRGPRFPHLPSLIFGST